MRKGERYIGKKHFLLGGRATGLNAREVAISEAAAKRKRGKIVRIIKLSNVEYLIYEH